MSRLSANRANTASRPAPRSRLPRNLSSKRADACLPQRKTPPDFVPWDIEVAEVNFGANCGPSAFAVITRTEVCRVMRYFLHFEHSQWTNLTQMRYAFEQTGYETTILRKALPTRGVALIQWLGPWTRKHFFSRWSLIHTHWIAKERDWVFDYTVKKWQSLTEWQQDTACIYLADIPRAYGWAVKYGVEVGNPNSDCENFGRERSVSSSIPAFNFSS